MTRRRAWVVTSAVLVVASGVLALAWPGSDADDVASTAATGTTRRPDAPVSPAEDPAPAPSAVPPTVETTEPTARTPPTAPPLSRGGAQPPATTAVTAPPPTSTTTATTVTSSGVDGIVISAPQCGARDCPPGPVQAPVRARIVGASVDAARTDSGPDGRFRLVLEPGDYVLVADAGGCGEVRVSIGERRFEEVTITCESGIV